MRSLTTQSVRSRLIASFLVVGVLVAGVGGFGVTRLGQLRDSTRTVVDQGFAPLVEANDLQNNYNLSTINFLLGLQTTDPAEQMRLFEEAATYGEQVTERIERLGAMDVPAEVHEHLEMVELAWTVYGALAAADTIDQADVDAAIEASGITDSTEAYRTMAVEVDAIIEVLEEATLRAAGEADQAYTAARNVTVAASVVGVLLAVALGAVVARRLVRPLRDTVEVLECVADGDLTRRLEHHGADEVGRMAAALNRTLDHLAGVIRAIGRDAEQLGAASGDVREASASMAATAEVASGRAETASTTVDEVLQGIQVVATATQEMTASIGEIAANAGEAATVAESAVDVARSASTTINSLGTSSAEINNVVKLINSIAEQTNLLALNATIEAARAGEAGRGFAVVAGEVKDLAQETAKATGDIAGRVQAIQRDVEDAVEAMDRITSIIDRVAALQTTIAGAVEEQSATTGEIGRNVETVAGGSSGIASHLQELAAAATETSSAAGGHRLTAEELNDMAQRLQSAVGVFRLDGEVPTTPAGVGRPGTGSAPAPTLLPTHRRWDEHVPA